MTQSMRFIVFALLFSSISSLATTPASFCPAKMRSVLSLLGLVKDSATLSIEPISSKTSPSLPPDIIDPQRLEAFEGRRFATMQIKHNPKFWEARGYKLRTDGKLEVQNWSGLNQLSDALNEAKDPDAPAFRFYEDTTDTGISRLEFAQRYVKGGVPIAKEGVTETVGPGREASLKEHDRLNHGPAYALVPKEVADSSRRNMMVLLSWLDAFPEKTYPKFHEYVTRRIDRLVGTIDNETVLMMDVLEPAPQWGKSERNRAVGRIEAALHIIGSSDRLNHMDLLTEIEISNELSYFDKVFLKQQIANVEKAGPTNEALRRMANRIYDLAGPYATAN